ncbi:component of gems protein 1-like [Bactrocera tryoni]|uniref:component of gems protein 1-like n=1 Tax=Bactrocera tryoni TaxID=59916 RepID=UPI001A96E6D3|nr:component of gems protein 1-like [Bactrocera tryoni]
MQHDSRHQNLEYIPRYNHHQNHNFSNHHQNNYSYQQQPPVEPMDIDSSTIFRRPTRQGYNKNQQQPPRNPQPRQNYQNPFKKEYKTGQTVYVKQNPRNKTNPRYLKKPVQENREDTILTTEGKIVHKDNLRNNDDDNANINPSNILSSGNNRLTRSQVRVNRD